VITGRSEVTDQGIRRKGCHRSSLLHQLPGAKGPDDGDGEEHGVDAFDHASVAGTGFHDRSALGQQEMSQITRDHLH